MSKKKIKVKTEKGVWNYSINKAGDLFSCYKTKLLFKTLLGEVTSVDEGIELIRLHANTNYGLISGIDIR